MRISHSVPRPMQAHQDLVLTWGPSPAVSVRDQLSLIAHELRGPLAALTISAELLADEAGSLDRQRIRAMAGLILRRGLWLQALVENLLYAGRLSEGPFRIAPHPTDLSCLLLDVESVVEPLLVQQDQLLKLCEATPLPPVMADARGISQVMINLILNASKYAPPGTPIDVHLTSAGPHVQVTVADRGPGIPADATERLFEPYYRLAPAAEPAADGVGLGLAIVKAIVEAHGGEVGAENRARGGAAFWFTLPVTTDAAAEQLAASQQERG